MIWGLAAELARTNCWTLGEYLGHTSPDRLQYLLARAVWDADEVRDDLRGYVVDELGAADAVLVLDETGDLKEGVKTVGVARQYTGTAGRVENCQVAVYAIWATSRGAAFMDRRLYLPQSWTSDPGRMREAGVPDDVGFATKPVLGTQMITGVLAAGYRPGYVTGDEVYGRSPDLRNYLHAEHVPYVMAIARTDPVVTKAADRRAIDLAVDPRMPWERISAGEGINGPRWYLWAWVEIEPPPGCQGCFSLLIRQSLEPNAKTGKPDFEFYRAYAPTPVRLVDFVRVAGTRWAVEEGFQTGKELAGLDQHQVRKWTSWQRWTILCMLAHALLTVITANQGPPPPGQERLSRNEVRHLGAHLTWAITHTVEHILAWSTLRRKRRYAARISHQKRQNKTPP
jgi:SRSO17 transposase